MKKFWNKIWFMAILSCCGVLVASCNDFFDVDPENGQKVNDYYRTIDEVNGAALGMYEPLQQNIHQLFLWGSARADLVEAGSGADAFIKEFTTNQISKINPYTNYSFLYKAIARCNHHLEHIGDFKTTESIRPVDMEVFYGEAYFLRALCYYYLVRTYGNVPLLLNDISEEVSYENEAGETVTLKTRDLSEEELRAIALQPTDQQEIWASILSDVNKSLKLMSTVNYFYPPYSNNNTFSYYLSCRSNQAAAYILAAEVAIWMGLYERASSMSEYILANKSVGALSTWSSQFTGNGIDGGYSAFVFYYQYENSFETNRMQEFTSNVITDGGKYLVKPALERVENLFSETKDVRRTSWMMVNRQPVIWKYIGKDETGASMRDPYQSDAPFHVFKNVDGYLLKGIAENRKGNSKAALENLNTVRGARGLEIYKEENISMKMEDLEDMLFKERARETAFEGRRWFDLMLLEKLGRKGILAETVSKKYPAAEQAAMKAYLQNEANWYLPIEPERWSKVEN